MSTAITNLSDFGFDPRAPNLWPTWMVISGACSLNIRIVCAAREVLSHHFFKAMWAEASPEHGEPLGSMPDVTAIKALSKTTAIKALSKTYSKHRKHRHAYYLAAIARRSMEVHAQAHFTICKHTRSIVCNHRSNNIEDQSLWEHLVIHCSVALQLLGDSDSIAHLLEQARFEVAFLFKDAFLLEMGQVA